MNVLRAPNDITVVRSTEVGNVEFVNGVAEEFTEEQAEYLAVLGFRVVDSESLENEEESASAETEDVPDAAKEDLRTPAEEEEDTREEESDPVEPRANEEVNDSEEESGEEDAVEGIGEAPEKEADEEEDTGSEEDPPESEDGEESDDEEDETDSADSDEEDESSIDEPIVLPTMRDNIATIKQFAEQNNISLEGASTKREMLSLIGEQLA